MAVNFRRRARWSAPALLLLLAASLPATPARAATATAITPPPPVSGPHVKGDRTEPVYDYARAVRESVRVNTTLDSDQDGRKDTIMVDIVRPAEAAAAGVKLPVIINPSPYFATAGRGDDGKKQYDGGGAVSMMPLFYDNYFVPRGYAVASLDLVGTARSTGCSDVGGPNDLASVTAVVDWLNGRNTATHRTGGAAVASWSTGNVGLVGKSYDGTVPNAAAATGIDGLRTIVPIVAISSWYDYTRASGLVHRTNYMGWLGDNNTNDKSKCARALAALNTAADDATGNYNKFWAARDSVKDAAKVRASVLVVHGLEDMNVMPVQFGRWWDALAANDVPRKLWLGRAEHTDPFDFRRAQWVATLHEWFDHWLSGLPTDIMRQPQADVEHEVNRWSVDQTWPVAKPVTVGIGPGVLGAAGSGTVSLTDKAVTQESQIVASPSQAQSHRQTFLSAPVSRDVRISGSPTVTLTIRANQRQAALSARLVDYGRADRYAGNNQISGAEECYGDKTATDDGCYRPRATSTRASDYGVIGRGWLSAEHRVGLTSPSPLTPGQWTEVTIPLMATDAVVRSGRRLGLVLASTDNIVRNGRASGVKIDIDLSRSRLNLPTNEAAVITPSRTAVPNTSLPGWAPGVGPRLLP
ncbi:CocE/NonD family hydrolase [Pilimelia columellifera]|uniref:Xaa-Pro dipeptidyl-peptidase n=1 Tax=Pilimelia columellifera subsp. columellifera TaxID=706583 RepID=A0ABP6AV31_9ACTN